jgi:hypothetical protein
MTVKDWVSIGTAAVACVVAISNYMLVHSIREAMLELRLDIAKERTEAVRVAMLERAEGLRQAQAWVEERYVRQSGR